MAYSILFGIIGDGNGDGSGGGGGEDDDHTANIYSTAESNPLEDREGYRSCAAAPSGEASLLSTVKLQWNYPGAGVMTMGNVDLEILRAHLSALVVGTSAVLEQDGQDPIKVVNEDGIPSASAPTSAGVDETTFVKRYAALVEDHDNSGEEGRTFGSEGVILEAVCFFKAAAAAGEGGGGGGGGGSEARVPLREGDPSLQLLLTAEDVSAVSHEPLRQLVNMLGQSITNTEELEYELVEYSDVTTTLEAALADATSDGTACTAVDRHKQGAAVCMSEHHFVAAYLKHTIGTRYIAELVFESMLGTSEDDGVAVDVVHSVLLLAHAEGAGSSEGSKKEGSSAVCRVLRSIVCFNDGNGGCHGDDDTVGAHTEL